MTVNHENHAVTNGTAVNAAMNRRTTNRGDPPGKRGNVVPTKAFLTPEPIGCKAVMARTTTLPSVVSLAM
jgi:hypothetical protein